MRNPGMNFWGNLARNACRNPMKNSWVIPDGTSGGISELTPRDILEGASVGMPPASYKSAHFPIHVNLTF